MKNQLTDLNNHLHAQLERLGDEDLSPEPLAREVARSKAISDTAKQIIANAGLVLAAQKAMTDRAIDTPIPMLANKSQ